MHLDSIQPNSNMDSVNRTPAHTNCMQYTPLNTPERCNVYTNKPIDRHQHRRAPATSLAARELLLAGVLHLCPAVAEQAGPEREEPRGVARDGHEEHAAVERHERQHEQVRHAHAQRVHRRARRPRRHAPPVPGFVEARVQAAGAQELEEEREREDSDKRQRVHAAARAGPPREEDHRVLAPEEGHVHPHAAVVRTGRGRRRCHAAHAVPSSHIHAAAVLVSAMCRRVRL